MPDPPQTQVLLSMFCACVVMKCPRLTSCLSCPFGEHIEHTHESSVLSNRCFRGVVMGSEVLQWRTGSDRSLC